MFREFTERFELAQRLGVKIGTQYFVLEFMTHTQQLALMSD